MCKQCKQRKPNPTWDSLLTDEEKELLRDVRCSIDLRTLSPKDVKVIVEHIKEMVKEEKP